MNWSLLNYFPGTKIPSHRYGYSEIRIWLNVPLKDMSMKRVRVEEFGESKGKIVDESILFFSRVSLSKFSLEALYFLWYEGVYSRVYGECEKLCFNQTGHSSDSTSQLDRVASLSCEIIAWLDWKFCPVVLQLACPFSSPTCFTRVPPLAIR